MFLAGGLGGALRGWTLTRIDPLAPKRRHIWGGFFAYALSQGLLVIPLLLLTLVIGLYNNGSPKQPGNYLLLFGLFGLLIGLITGLVQGLLTVKLRQSWRVILAVLGGYTLGGLLVGVLFWQVNFLDAASSPTLRLLLLLSLLALATGLPVGGVSGLVYHWIAGLRASQGQSAVQPGRLQQISVTVIGVLLFVFMAALSRNIVNFLTIPLGVWKRVSHVGPCWVVSGRSTA